MATRTIVTSQPDVACELCARRLLRGEHHEVFVADGRQRTVCELCAPRAADAGWVRARDGQATLAPIAAPRRGRGILERLRLGSRAGEQASGQELAGDSSYEQPGEGSGRGSRRRHSDALAEGSSGPVGTEGPFQQPAAAIPAAPTSPQERAAAVFNASEYPRRMAGLMRSLGAPAVCILPAEHLGGAVRITLAWELCWYRYEVDLTTDPPQARPLEQGTELSQLSREERHANAHVAEDGTVFL